MGGGLVTLVVFYYLKVIPVHDILTVFLEFHCRALHNDYKSHINFGNNKFHV